MKENFRVRGQPRSQGLSSLPPLVVEGREERPWERGWFEDWYQSRSQSPRVFWSASRHGALNKLVPRDLVSFAFKI